MIVVIANTHYEARDYCQRHDLSPRSVITATPACCSSRLAGISITPDDEVVNLIRGSELSDHQYAMYQGLLEDLQKARIRGGSNAP